MSSISIPVSQRLVRAMKLSMGESYGGVHVPTCCQYHEKGGYASEPCSRPDVESFDATSADDDQDDRFPRHTFVGELGGAL